MATGTADIQKLLSENKYPLDIVAAWHVEHPFTGDEWKEIETILTNWVLNQIVGLGKDNAVKVAHLIRLAMIAQRAHDNKLRSAY